jgi:ubiquinone/menaquinone biosynthesis C-methylase UbiE
MSFEEHSYKQHGEHFAQYTSTGSKAAQAMTWRKTDSVDAWRHQRMYQVIDPILRSQPEAKWLTVGDGRYGCDARYIMDKGCEALPTDISGHLLEEAKETGYIDQFKVENAENLSFEDSSFDYVLCKESYHHFPRPMVAYYEMLRVAKHGVVLIEPNDSHIAEGFLKFLFRGLRDLAKLILGKSLDRHTYEESGNYVFKISRREIEKVALGLNYKAVAFKGINDMHYPGAEFEKMAENGPIQRKIKRFIGVANFTCKLGIFDYGSLAAVIFKAKPQAELCTLLKNAGYELIHLPDNPYISQGQHGNDNP